MHLVFDFDGTITRQDTISVLAGAARAFQQHERGVQGDLEATWSRIVQCYLDDLQAYKAGHLVPEAERRTVAQEQQFLAGSKDVELASLARVEDSGVFSGLDPRDLFQMGVDAVKRGDVTIRDGFKEMVTLAKVRGWEVAVTSVNWSGAFIKGVLHSYNIRIVANEISHSGKILGPELIQGRLTNSPEKRKVLDHLVGANRGHAFYFGDSTTDMDCILGGGFVIAEGEASSLVRTLRRVGFPVPHVSQLDIRTENIMWARDFHEILQSPAFQA